MITRRGLLTGILAAGAAPVIVRSGVLMPIRPLIIPTWRPWCTCPTCMATGRGWFWRRDDEYGRLTLTSIMELQAFVKRLDATIGEPTLRMVQAMRRGTLFDNHLT